jgi:hypothetical protein
MVDKPIQEQFGEKLLETFRQFARSDLGSPAEYEANQFGHVADGELRTTLAETMYGARWLYKLGLALLVQDAELLAHVRAQVLDYASICEALLGEMIRHAISSNLAVGNKYKFRDTRTLTKPIPWARGIHAQFKELPFYWRIVVAAEEVIIDAPLADKLHNLRLERNTVHLHSRTHRAYLRTSRDAFSVLTETIQQTRTWRNANP